MKCGPQCCTHMDARTQTNIWQEDAGRSEWRCSQNEEAAAQDPVALRPLINAASCETRAAEQFQAAAAGLRADRYIYAAGRREKTIQVSVLFVFVCCPVLDRPVHVMRFGHRGSLHDDPACVAVLLHIFVLLFVCLFVCLLVCLFVCLFVLEPCARVSIVVNFSQQLFVARQHLQVAGIVYEAVFNDSASVSNDFKAASVISEAAGVVSNDFKAAGVVKAGIAAATSGSELTGGRP